MDNIWDAFTAKEAAEELAYLLEGDSGWLYMEILVHINSIIYKAREEALEQDMWDYPLEI